MPNKRCRKCKLEVDGATPSCPRCGEALFDAVPPVQPSPTPAPAPSFYAQHVQEGMSQGGIGVQPSQPYQGQPYPYQTQSPRVAPPQYQQPTTAQIAYSPTTGQPFDRGVLQRRLAEKKRKRNRLLKIGVPIVVLLLAVGIFLPLWFLVINKGMSVEEYQRQATLIHARVIDPMNQLDEDWDTRNWEDESLSFMYGELLNEIDVLEETLGTAKSDLSSLKRIPKEAQGVQGDLLAYYDELLVTLTDMRVMFNYLEQSNKVVKEWQDTPSLFGELGDDPSRAQVISALQYEVEQDSTYMNRISSLNPTDPEVKAINDGLVGLLNERIVVNTGLKEAMVNYDYNTFVAYADQYETDYDTMDATLMTIYRPLLNLGTSYTNILDEGEALQKKIDRIGTTKSNSKDTTTT
jgi:hypothetical protein